MARLTKRQVEDLLSDYDDDPVAALTTALRVVLNAPEHAWTELLALLPFPGERLRSLVELDQHALDELTRELNELRTIDQ